MEKYELYGMSCAACAARIEKAVNAVCGVQNVAVSLLTNSMSVEGTAQDSEIIRAVENAGYGAKNVNKNQNAKKEVVLKDTETPLLLKRLVWSVIFLAVLMYFSMGHMMLGFPLPPFFAGNHVAVSLVQLILCVIVLFINQKFFRSGFKALFHFSANMDTLVAMGSGVSFLWSVLVLFLMTKAVADGNQELAHKLMGNLYFESSAMILTLITVGKTLEAKSKGRTTDALRSLMKLAPKTATVIRDGKEFQIDVEQLVIGDIFVVRPGESIPVDGVVEEGVSAVNEASLTGESLPCEKAAGSRVFSGTLNQSGFLKCKATKVGKDTTLNQIIQMVSDAATTKAPIAKIADKVSGVFVPSVIAIALVTFVVWKLTGSETGFALARGISVLVISCPCALGLATPVAIMVGNGKGARNGILFKTAESLEIAGKADVVVLDKTGTITKGEMSVSDIISTGLGNHNLWDIVLALESKSEHPIAKALCAKALEEGGKAENVQLTGFTSVGGKGVWATEKNSDDNNKFFAGNLNFIEENCNFENDELLKSKNECDKLSVEGKTPVLFAIQKENISAELLGIVSVSDEIKEDSPAAILELRKLGKKVVMLTGDNEITAKEIGRQAGVDEVIAGVLPDGKLEVVRRLQKNARVLMIGDGINDAPALTQADVGIAIGAGTDVALDAADVVLMNSSLMDAVKAVKLSRKTLLNIKENLFWAFIYNVIGIPLAAGAYIHLFGWTLNPMFGAAAMSLSSFCVVMNALRLNFVKLGEEKNISNKSTTERKEKTMKKTLKVEGMMCQHCEKHVKDALEKIDGVVSAVTSHEKATAIVELSKDVDEKLFEKAVVDAGYEYKGIE